MKAQLKTVEQVLEEADRNKDRNIAQRINAAMAEVDYIQKEKKSGMNYSIVSHDAVTAKVRPILQAHGVVYYPKDFQAQQNGNRTELIFTVRFENVDNREDYIDVATMGYGVDAQDKGPGKAISYGVKYALLKVLGLETGDDPDEVQDNRANYSPRVEVTPASTRPTEPADREKLEGMYTSKSALKAAMKAFAETLREMGDLGEFSAWMATEEVVELEKSALRYLPHWWDSGEGMPAEFVPMSVRIAQKKRDLEQLENV